MPKQKKQNYTYAVGRRKSASARVRLFRGKGETTVNGKVIDKYLVGKSLKAIWLKPFMVTETSEKYYATVRVLGGGQIGQSEAIAHGIARALSKVDKEGYRSALKKAGLLTRDHRVRERRKVGTGGKARRQKQSPKR